MGTAASYRRLLDAWALESDPHTAVAPEDAVDLHVADSLAALTFAEVRQARAIADIGAGAGFPGLALAIALPAARVDLIESAGRKVALIERLAAAARVGNARAVRARVEEWAAAAGRGGYDVACARAGGPLAALLEHAGPVRCAGGPL